MAIHPDTPEPLKNALEQMEAQVRSFKSSIAFAAPELHDLHYAVLQEGLADAMAELYEAASTKRA